MSEPERAKLLTATDLSVIERPSPNLPLWHAGHENRSANSSRPLPPAEILIAGPLQYPQSIWTTHRGLLNRYSSVVESAAMSSSLKLSAVHLAAVLHHLPRLRWRAPRRCCRDPTPSATLANGLQVVVIPDRRAPLVDPHDVV